MTNFSEAERRELPDVAAGPVVRRPIAIPSRGVAVSHAKMTGELVASVARLEEIRPQWLQLLDRAAPTTPFDHPAFLLPWFGQAGQDGFDVSALAVWNGERLAALLPLSTKRTVGRMVRRLSPPLYGSTPPFDLIAEDEPGIGEAIDRFFERTVGWDVVDWPAMPTRSRVAMLVAKHLRQQGHTLRIAPQEARYGVELSGDWKTYLASLRRHDRKEIGRCGRVAETTGEVNYAIFRPGDTDLEAHLKAARVVIAASWKNSGEMTARGLAHLETLGRSLAQAGMFQIHTLLVDGQPIAYLSEIAYGGRRYAFHIAYDGRHSAFSPGRLVLMRAMRIACEEGVPYYAFCGYRDYLRRLANTREEFCSIEIVNRSMLSRARAKSADIVRRLMKPEKPQHAHKGESE